MPGFFDESNLRACYWSLNGAPFDFFSRLWQSSGQKPQSRHEFSQKSPAPRRRIDGLLMPWPPPALASDVEVPVLEVVF
jgi:hypothetical protein